MDLKIEIKGEPVTLDLTFRRSHKLKIMEKTSFDVSEMEQYDKLDDQEILLECLWIVVCEQCQALKINEDQFKDSIHGEGFESSKRALVVGIQNFSPQKLRSIFSSILELDETKRKAVEKAADQLKEKLPEALKKVETKSSEFLAKTISDL